MNKITVFELTRYGITCDPRSSRWQFPLATFDSYVMFFCGFVVLSIAVYAIF